MPAALVDIAGLADLKGICEDGDRLVVGALTTHAEVAANPLVNRRIPALADLVRHIGDPQVRNRGTIGGSLANNDPVSDYPAAVAGLAADIKTDRRTIAADDFFRGLFETALDDQELIKSVWFAAPDKAAYLKFPNPASNYAMAGVFVAVFGERVRVAVTGAGQSGVFRIAAMEEALAGDFRPEALDTVDVPAAGMNDDIHGSSDYRAHLVKVMAKRAVAACG
jgi:carbon-monoxide dehydrogenase medium subunit